VPYFAYRQAAGSWPAIPVHLLRLLFFVVLSVVLVMAEGWSGLAGWSALALLAFMVFKARRELAVAVKAATRLDRPVPR
jgi:hypothetical protein